jgi:hypothetical protein
MRKVTASQSHIRVSWYMHLLDQFLIYFINFERLNILGFYKLQPLGP